jgi:hypothetical protein
MTATPCLSGGIARAALIAIVTAARPRNRLVRDAGSQHNVRIRERNGNDGRSSRRQRSGRSGVKEVVRSTDPVRLSFLTALLSDGGVAAILFDTHASIVQGSLGVLPQRLMVADEDYDQAVAILKTANEWHEPERSGWL